MKVIFIRDLKGQGKIGDIKEVKDGYGKNFLIKNKYAVLLTNKSLEKLQEENKIKDILEEEAFKDATNLKVKLEKEKLLFIVKTGKDKKMFGSISAKQIHDELKKRGYEIVKKDIFLDAAITHLGIHKIKIQLYKGILASIEIKVNS